MSLWTREKQVAISAVTTAARVCEHVRQTMVMRQVEVVPPHPPSLDSDVGCSNTTTAAATTATKTISDIMIKEDQSPVTVADYGAQAVVCAALWEAFPNDPVVAEEDTTGVVFQPNTDGTPNDFVTTVTQCVQTVLPNATKDNILQWIHHGNGKVSHDRYWTLDPIDGTKGFIRGDQYAVALALIEQGEVKVGVLACPALSVPRRDNKDVSSMEGVLFVAVRGQGTHVQCLFEDDTSSWCPPLRLDNTTTTAATIQHRMVESWESSHSHPALQKLIAQVVGIPDDAIPPLRMDSQAKYGVVALGQASMYLRLPNPQKPNYKENIWDHAAGSIIVQEAGGRVTNMRGENLNYTEGTKFTGTGVVVSIGEGTSIHEKILSALQNVSY
jgi:3'(2'), 5'-bisphosphate nucleotidase